jgi:WD40 repeat protein
MSHSRGLLVVAASFLSALIVCSLALAQEALTKTEFSPGPTFHHAFPRHLSFSAGDALLACSDVEGHVEVFDMATEETVWTWGHPETLETSEGELLYPSLAKPLDIALPEVFQGWPGRTLVKFPPHGLQWMAVSQSMTADAPLVVEHEEHAEIAAGHWRIGGYCHLYKRPDFERTASLELRRPERVRRGLNYGGMPSFAALEFSPVEPLIAGGDNTGYLSLWWAPDHSYIGRQRGDSQSMCALSFNHSGDLIATLGRSGIVRLWAVDKLQLLAELEGHNVTREGPEDLWIGFSPDGSLVASSAMDGTLRLWNVKDECEQACITLPAELGERPRFAFASGSDWVYAVGSAAVNKSVVTVFGRLDLDTGLFTKLLDMEDREIWAMVCSPTRNFLAMADGKNDEILTWHIWPPSAKRPVVTGPTKEQGLPKTESP